MSSLTVSNVTAMLPAFASICGEVSVPVFIRAHLGLIPLFCVHLRLKLLSSCLFAFIRVHSRFVE